MLCYLTSWFDSIVWMRDAGVDCGEAAGGMLDSSGAPGGANTPYSLLVE